MVDVGLGVHPLADAQRLLEQHVERGPDGAGLLADTQRLTHLTEDLALADDHGVQARGDVEQVRDGAVVVVHVEVGYDVLRRSVDAGGQLAQQPGHRLDAAVEAVDLGVDLDAVARREHGRLEHVVGLGDGVHELVDAGGVERQPLEHRHRSGLVGDAHHQDTHGLTMPREWPASDLRCSW